jgi:hypothetical protein
MFEMGSSSSKTEHQSDISSSSPSTVTNASTSQTTSSSQYPKPKGDEYDKFEKLISTLPKVIEAENLREVEEYIQACDKGKGPAVACFSTAEYLSLVDLNHEEASALYENTCFRPKHDQSPNLVEMDDGTKAYPPACFNLARFRMTVRYKAFNSNGVYSCSHVLFICQNILCLIFVVFYPFFCSFHNMRIALFARIG